MDWRTTPANDRVADLSLKGQVEGLRFVEGESLQVCVPVADLHRNPGVGRRERQLLFGDGFRVLERCGNHAFGQSVKDGYCGWLSKTQIGPLQNATHIIFARSSFGFSKPNIKDPQITPLSFGSRLRIVGVDGAFAQTAEGLHVPQVHLRPVDDLFVDPIAVAQIFLGTPYLWGGNSGHGIDCSGLVQAALLACGIDCPGDSDLQEQALGQRLSDNDETLRGDLFFWKGHVAMAVDADTLIHANAYSMSVAYEPTATAISRIAAAGDGPVTSRRRI